MFVWQIMSGRRIISRIVEAIPEPIAERILPWKRAAFRSAGVAPARRERSRLFIGPVNSAGQGYRWARAAERLVDVAATDFMYRTPTDVFDYPADQTVDTVYFRMNQRWERAQRRAVERRYTHVIIESGRQIIGTKLTLTQQISSFQSKGLRVALLWHGSDIRIPSRHAATDPDSPFHPGRYADTERLERIALENHALSHEAGLPVFVSTPDLLAETPTATWLPVVVDIETWCEAGSKPPLTAGRPPIVVHAPSNAGLKGSNLITDTLRRLHKERVLDYREIHRVPAADMPALYGDADIVLDQFALGIYGVAACEAMAAGRIVVSHVSDEVREAVRVLTGDELPVVQARAADLEQVLKRIIDEPEKARHVAASGQVFVRRHHDGSRSAEALRPFLMSTT